MFTLACNLTHTGINGLALNTQYNQCWQLSPNQIKELLRSVDVLGHVVVRV